MSSIDVIVPCYNYARFLPTCVNSVLTQSLSDVRVLIIDDASTDESSAVAEEIVNRDRRVEFRRHNKNRGNIETYNEGLDWAAGDYLLLLSADDWLVPGALMRAAHVLDNHPDVVLTCGHAAVAEEGKSLPEIPFQTDRCKYQVITGQEFIGRTCKNSNESPLWTPTAVVRTSIQKKIGGYNKDLPHAGDLEMWLRFACYGSVCFLDAFQAYYRKHGSNMHEFFVKTALANNRQHLCAFDSVFLNHKDKIADYDKLQEIYRRSFALDALNSASRALDRREFSDFNEYLAFSYAVNPRIRRSRQWYRLQLKKLLGPAIAKQLRGIKRFLREKIVQA